MKGTLAGQVVLVTGAGRGIGASTALELALRGAKVGLVDVDAALAAETEATIHAQGGEALALPTDVSDRQAIHEAGAALAKRFGPLTAVVNNAIWIRYEPVDAVTEDVLGRMLGIGLKGTFWGVQALLAHRDPAVPASIVNLASPAADLGVANTSSYSAIKGAIVALTRQLAVELGPQGVRVNAVAPGAVPTPGARGIVSEEGYALRKRQTPLGRLGTPEDVARAIAFLISMEADFVTGEVLHADGGISVKSM